MIESFESKNGNHWRENEDKRPLYKTSAGDVVWFIMGHILLLPLAVAVLLLTALCLPLYTAWSYWRRKHPVDPRLHPEAKHIVETPGVNDAFIFGAKDEARPAVSVVMPFYNRENLVDWAVGSVLRSAVPMTMEVEIIAVDNGSTDGTVERLKRHPVRIVHCSEKGPGAARNAGIRAARAPIVVFTDSDCLAEADWLMRMVRPYVDSNILMTGGRIDTMYHDDHVATFTDDVHILCNRRFFLGGPYFPRFFATANMACRKDALENINGFDKNLWMSEDADLCWRLLDEGGIIAYIDDAVIYHQHRTTLKSLFLQAIDYGAASVSNFAKHRSKIGVDAVVSWKNIRDIAWSPFQIILDQFRAKDSYERQREVMYMLWRLGFTYGSIRESLKQRVLFF